MADIINRENAETLIREQVISTVFSDVPQESIFMSLARRLPNMTSSQTRIPVLDMLPMAYWVDGDTGFKATSKQAWDNVYLNAAELAVIVPIPEAVINDSEFDIIGEVTPRIMEAVGKCVDEAVIFGKNRPAAWQNDIITAARLAGNNVPVSSSTNYYDAIMGADGVLEKIENCGYMSTGAVASMSMRSKLRGLKDSSGMPIFSSNMQGATQYALDGAATYFPRNGSFDQTAAQLIVGDWSQAVYSIRQDVSVKILDQGVIQNPITKAIEYNLAQQDMIALRVVFRMGWALPNPATRMNSQRTGCPFAYIEPVTPETVQTVTFTVKSGSNAVEGAVVNVNGSRLVTNSSGVATASLRAGDYPVTVTCDGYKKVTDSVTVASSAVSKAISLTAV